MEKCVGSLSVRETPFASIEVTAELDVLEVI